jgi:LysM repeat protein
MEKGTEEKKPKKRLKLKAEILKDLAILTAGISLVVYTTKKFSYQKIEFTTDKGKRELADYEDFFEHHDINYRDAYAESQGNIVTVYVKTKGEHIVGLTNPNTINDIVKFYKMDKEEFLRINHLKEEQALEVGQKLEIYWYKPYNFTLEELDASSDWNYHLINEGETLSQIAEKYNTTEEEIMENNKEIIDKNQIKAGSTIKIKKQKNKEKQKTLEK